LLCVVSAALTTPSDKTYSRHVTPLRANAAYDAHALLAHGWIRGRKLLCAGPPRRTIVSDSCLLSLTHSDEVRLRLRQPRSRAAQWARKIGGGLRRGVAAVAVAALLASERVYAAPMASDTPPVPLASGLTGEAKTAYERGRQLYQAGDAGAAFTMFSRAYELTFEPRLLWNMGACRKTERRYARAHALVSAYLHDAGDAVSADMREMASETLVALRSLFAVVQLDGVPPGARVLVDGEEVGRVPPSELSLDVGAHALRVEREGFIPFASAVDIRGPSDVMVRVVMRVDDTGKLVVSAPPGAVIRVDGARPTLGRWEGAVAAGMHAIAVTAPGKRPYGATIVVAARSHAHVEVTLDPEPWSAPWPWIAGGAALTAIAAVGAYLTFRPRDVGRFPEGGLATFVIQPGAGGP